MQIAAYQPLNRITFSSLPSQPLLHPPLQPNVFALPVQANIEKLKVVAKAVSENWLSDTINLAKTVWTKIKAAFRLILDVLHKAVKYIGKNPVVLLYGLGEFHHHH